ARSQVAASGDGEKLAGHGVGPSGAFLRQGVKSSTESAADLCQFLVLGQQDGVRTVRGHKLPFFWNRLSAQHLPRRTTRIYKEKLAMGFRYVGAAVHSHSPDGRIG